MSADVTSVPTVEERMVWEVTLELPPRDEFSTLAMDACWSVTGGLSLDDRYRRNLQQALREVFLGAVRRAIPPADKLPLQIRFCVSPTQFEVRVHEHGMPYGDEGLLDAGLLNIQRLVDGVLVSNLGREGTEISISISLQRKTLEHFLSKKEWSAVLQTGAESPPSVRRDEPFEVRPLRPEEAVEISRCAYLSYGYSYLHDAIYYPDRVREMNKSGAIVSLVCSSLRTQEIMGHTALRRDPAEGMGELVMAFVKPEFRGNGCLEAMTTTLLQKARDEGQAGAYVCSVTSHTYSQKVATRQGFSECALFLSRLLSMNFQGINQTKGQREALLVCYRLFARTGVQELHVPIKYLDIVSRIMAGVGVNVVPASEVGPDLANKTELTIETDSQKTGHIRVRSYGANARLDVNRALRSLCIRRMETIYLYLPLTSSATVMFAPLFESMHFFFCGVSPAMGGTHHLVLQFLNNQTVDYDSIKMESELGKSLLAYIRSQDPFHDFSLSQPPRGAHASR